MHCTRTSSYNSIACGAWGRSAFGPRFLASRRINAIVPPERHSALPADSSLNDVLFDLQIRFKQWLSRNRLQCSCRRFTLASIHRDRNSTAVCTFSCKAAQAPPLISWLYELSTEFAAACPAADKDEAELVVACLWGLSTYVCVIKSGGCFFTDEEAELLDRCGHAYLFAYSALAAKQTNHALWHHIPKHHHFHHLILDAVAEKMNPRFFHCFSDEDFIGQMLKVAKRGHANTVVEHTVSFWIVGAKQRFEG
jgi:hypothetical protein